MRSTKSIRWLAGVVALVFGVVYSPHALAQGAEIVLETDVAYTTRDGAKLLLDIARRTAPAEPSAAVVFVHDWGYLVAGRDVYWMPYRSVSKADFAGEIRMAAERGYVGVAVNYRLPVPQGSPASGTRFPGQVYDVKAAIRWLRSNAERYAIDPDRIGVVGFGLGGYLALMLALTGPRDGLEGEGEPAEPASMVQAAVALAPPVDWLSEMRGTDRGLAAYRAAIAGLLGGLPEEVPDQYRKADPIRYFGFGDAPLLAVFSGSDMWVEPQEAAILTDKMVARAARHSVLMVPGANSQFADLASPRTDYPMWGFLDMCLNAR